MDSSQLTRIRRSRVLSSNTGTHRSGNTAETVIASRPGGQAVFTQRIQVMGPCCPAPLLR